MRSDDDNAPNTLYTYHAFFRNIKKDRYSGFETNENSKITENLFFSRKKNFPRNFNEEPLDVRKINDRNNKTELKYKKSVR